MMDELKAIHARLDAIEVRLESLVATSNPSAIPEQRTDTEPDYSKAEVIAKTLDMWVAQDEDGECYWSLDEPDRGITTWVQEGCYGDLPDDLFGENADWTKCLVGPNGERA